MNAGISFNNLEQLFLTGVYAGSGQGSGSGSGSGETGRPAETVYPPEVPVVYSDQAFHLYWDDESGGYKMRDPVVIAPNGEQVECEALENLEPGVKYFCVVTLDGGEYSAEILSEDAADGKQAGDSDGLWKVPLFKVPPEDDEEAESDDESGYQFHAGAIVLGGGEGDGSAKPDKVSVDYRTAVDGQGNPKTRRETVDGVEVDVPEKTNELEVKGWHEDDPVGGSSLAELMGLPVSGESSNDVIVRDGGRGGPLRYYKVGRVDPSQMPVNPCRVVSISDGNASGAGITPSKLYDLVHTGEYITVEYAREGDCEDSDGGQFTIPIVGPAGITGTVDVVTDVDYRLDQDEVRRLYATKRTLTFVSGVLKEVGSPVETLLAETIKHSQVYPSGT